MTPGTFFLLLQLYALTLLVYVVLVSYGVLTAQLFDIDFRIRWTVRQSTVAAAFVAVYFFGRGPDLPLRPTRQFPGRSGSCPAGILHRTLETGGEPGGQFRSAGCPGRTPRSMSRPDPQEKRL